MLFLDVAPGGRPNDSQAAYRLLRRRYEAVFGNGVPEILRTEQGKPYFADGSAQFSLAHTKTMVACALSDQAVGLDLEWRTAVLPAVVRRVLTEQELEVYRQSEDPLHTFLTFWTLKEAYVKYTGDGLRWRMKDYCFDLSGAAPRLLGESTACITGMIGKAVYSLCMAQRETPVIQIWNDKTGEDEHENCGAL